MELSILIARLIGVLYLATALGFILSRPFYEQLVDEFSKSRISMFFGGAAALVVGLLIITFHNEWDSSWRVAITIIGWLSLLKGIGLILFPAWSMATIPKMRPWYFKAAIPAALALGIFFTYFGFRG